MRKYHVGDRTVLLVDGELFEKVLPLGEAEEISAVENVSPTRRGPKPRKPFNTVLAETRERKRRNVLGPEAEETIKAEIAAGMGLTETCKKYEISVSKYYALKGELKSRPVRED